MKYLFLIIIVLILAGGAYVIGTKGYSLSINKPSPKVSSLVIGGDKDEHGCYLSAGYSWCEKKQKCIKPWEEICDVQSETQTLIAAIKAALIEKHGQSAAELNVTVAKIEGYYAQGGANGQGGGGMWFAAKDNGLWKLVWDGNGIIECNDLINYSNFPASMIPECFDKTKGDIIKR